MFNVDRGALGCLLFLIVFAVGGIATILWGLIIGIIVTVVVFCIIACMTTNDKEILEKKVKAGDQDAQKQLDNLIAKEAEDNYNKGLQILDKKGSYHANTWFEKAAKQGHLGAKNKLVEIEKETKERAKREAAERKEREKAEVARFAAMPKCPRCGGPIEAKYVNQYWGSRYYHATYAPDCTWSDDKLREPYQPR